MALANLALVEVALAAVCSLQPCAIDSNQFSAKQIKAAAHTPELAEDFPERRFILTAEVGNGFEVTLHLTH